MFSLDLLCVSSVCACLQVCLQVCAFADVSESRSSTSVCSRQHVSVCTLCMSVCACMRVVVLVSSFDCLHLYSQLLLPTFLAPFSQSFRPSIPRCLPPHVAPSRVGVDTERPTSALLTLCCCDNCAQTSGSTWALFILT